MLREPDTTTAFADADRVAEAEAEAEAEAYEALLDELRANVEEVTVEQAQRLLSDGEVDVLLDVREPVEWAERRLPDAVHVPLGLVEWRFNPSALRADPLVGVTRDARMVVYCAAGFRSLLAGEFLKSMGYSNVVSMEGGITEWAARGLPVETAARGPFVHSTGA